MTDAAALSPWGLFLQADIVVKAVMALLLAASVWSWAIIADRWLKLRAADRAAAVFETRFWDAGALDKLARDAAGQRHPAARLFTAVMGEWTESVREPAHVDRDGVRQRLDGAMRVSIDRDVDQLSDRLSVLATIGSVAPFVGLFGTVWGIMRSFLAIAGAQNTSLAVVAPGIAEALFATAIGLFAAIPAVIGYNRLLHRVGKLEGRLTAFAGEVHATLSRQLDTLGRPHARAQAVRDQRLYGTPAEPGER